jgi:putative ABC transport system permease protein
MNTVDRFWCRAYRAALRLYPLAYRREYAVGMAETFEDRVRAARAGRGTGAVWVLGLRELLGVVVATFRQHLRGTRPERRRTTTGRLPREFRFAVRRMVNAPGFAAASILTLALGIGANTAIFSVAYHVVIKSLPYPDSDRIVWLDHAAAGLNLSSGLGYTDGLFQVVREQNHSLDEVAVFQTLEVTLSGDGEPERVAAAHATFTLAEVFQTPPIIGRWLREDDQYANGVGAVVLSHGLWHTRYGSDPGVLGRTVRIQGIPHEIVGVMPAQFAFPQADTQLWVPRVITPNRFGGFDVQAVARLLPGVSMTDTRRDLEAIVRMVPDYFGTAGARQVVEVAKIAPLVTPLKEYLTGDVARSLWILFGTVACVLLIACANVANLVMVRAEGQQRAVAVRTALGADRLDVAWYFLAESGVVGLGGGIGGIGLAYAGVRVLVASAPTSIPRLHEIAIDGNVLLFSLAITLGSTFVFGCLPLLAKRAHISESLKDGTRGVTGGKAGVRSRHVLVTGQIALALVLLVAAGLMVRSFWNLKVTDIGFDTADVLTFEIGLSNTDYGSRERATAFQEELRTHLGALPGVVSVGGVSRCLPFGSWCGGDPLRVQGRVVDPGTIPPVVALRTVTPGYLETMKIPLLSGRFPERSDYETPTNAVVVSQRLAQLYWPDTDAVGQRIQQGLGSPTGTWYTVVGVVGDVSTKGPGHPGDPIVYFPLLSTDNRGPTPGQMWFVVRTSTPPLGLLAAVRRVVTSLDPNVPVAHAETLAQMEARARVSTTFSMLLLGLSAIVALTLGAVGVYGVIAYVVARRAPEIGLRIALGATPSNVFKMVLGQGALVGVIGVGVGVGAAIGVTRLMSSLLYEVTPTDLPTLASVSVLLLGITVVASYLPARRASRVDPLDALRAG